MKILIIRFSSIGDIVLCTPIIRACAKQLNAEVHLLTKQRFAGLLENNPYLSKTHSFSEQLSEVRELLVQEDYDYVIDLHKNIRSRQVISWLGKPSGTFPKLNVEKWLYVNFKVNRLPSMHIVDRYFMAHPELTNDGLGLDYIVRKESKIDLKLKSFICLVLGATYYTKRIPEDILIKIIQGISSKIVLIGGPEEESLGDSLASDNENVTNGCGKYSIDQSASLLEQSELVISSDTGMMHISAALKKPIIMMWGNTVPDFGMGPYHTEAFHFQVEGLPCRPCSKLGKDACPKQHFKCMKNQDIDELLELVNRRMGGDNSID